MGSTAPPSACDPIAGCQYTPNNGVCDDGVPCTDNICDVTFGLLFKVNHGACMMTTWSVHRTSATQPRLPDNGG